MKVSPPPHWTFTLHHTPPISNLFLLCSTPSPLVGIGPKHPKRKKTGSEYIAAVVEVVLLDFCSGNQYRNKYLIRIVYQLLRPMIMNWRWMSKTIMVPRILLGLCPVQNPPVSVVAPNPLSSNMDPRYFLLKKTPFFE